MSEIRSMTAHDFDAVGAIYTLDMGSAPPDDWRSRVIALLYEQDVVALVAEGDMPDGTGVQGYIVGEVRSWEFGSEPAAWIFAVGVHPEAQNQGVARRLLTAAIESFRHMGVMSIRTMVRRDDVEVLRFFRNSGFVAGPYTELELSLPEETPS